MEQIAAATRQPTITLVTSDGKTLASYGDLYGESVQLRELPEHLPAAVLATEDRRFYDHFGLDREGPDPGDDRQYPRRAHRPGRQHDHPAIGQEPVPDASPHRQAQGAGGDAGAVDGTAVLQGSDPDALSEPRLSGRRHLWRRSGVPEILQQIGAQSHAAGSRHAGWSTEGAVPICPDHELEGRAIALESRHGRYGRCRLYRPGGGQQGRQGAGEAQSRLPEATAIALFRGLGDLPHPGLCRP